MYIFVSLPSATVQLPGSRGYHDKVIDHYENPRNVGSLDKNDENVGTGLVGAPACGDVMKLQVYQTIFRYFTISVTKIIMQMKFNFNSNRIYNSVADYNSSRVFVGCIADVPVPFSRWDNFSLL